MKQLLKKCLVMVVMFTTIGSYSNVIAHQSNDPTKNVTSISIDSVSEGSLFLLKDNNGIILYSEKIKNAGTYAKRFDLSNLPDADYYFELDKQAEVIVIPFIIKENVAEIIADEKYNVVKPEVIVRDDRVYISQISNEEQTWKIKVYYDEGYDLAYSEILKNTQNLTKVYDFSSSKKGSYTIVFSSGDRVFKNSILIP